MRVCGGVVFLLALLVIASYGQDHYYKIDVEYKKPTKYIDTLQHFVGPNEDDHWFTIQIMDDSGDQGMIGGKNHFFVTNTNAHDLTNMSMIVWKEDASSKEKCLQRSDQENYCFNYIRVMLTYGGNTVTNPTPQLYVCGTNAFNPKCRIYPIASNGTLMEHTHEESGIGSCPYSPLQGSTALMADDKLFAGTLTRSDGRDPIIQKRTIIPFAFVVTPFYNTYKYLSDPTFVSSFEMDDKVYFFFREMPLQGEHCEQRILSRVARVCKNDAGFPKWFTSPISFTSFFKATLSCSVQWGTFPHHFDEIKETSNIGLGNLNPSSDSSDAHRLVYGVFGSSRVPGMSAVCAFRLADITDVFNGKFKTEVQVPGTYQFYWKSVPDDEVPTPHPTECGAKADHDRNSQTARDFRTFVTTHPLMDGQVKPRGGKPVLTSNRSNFTCIAVDWQQKGIDGTFYDVLFVGTSDGRVLKSISVHTDEGVQHKVIEDLQVFDRPVMAVTELKVLIHSSNKKKHKLIVVSKREIVSIPLHRCGKQCSCRACVALKDPYCTWLERQKKCAFSNQGIQSIATGTHDTCNDDDVCG